MLWRYRLLVHDMLQILILKALAPSRSQKAQRQVTMCNILKMCLKSAVLESSVFQNLFSVRTTKMFTK